MDQTFTLFLIPVPLGEDADHAWVSSSLVELINRLQFFVVENERTARRHLRKMGYTRNFDQVKMWVLDENSEPGRARTIFEEIRIHGEAGLMSEAGVPGIADPGEELVWEVQKMNGRLVPVPGPSSLLLALMASGLNGERFSFNGYLPVKSDQRKKELKQLESRSKNGNGAQLFIETPYRSQAMWNDLQLSLDPETKVCIASNIGMADELIQTRRMKEWKKKPPVLDKRLCIFILDV